MTGRRWAIPEPTRAPAAASGAEADDRRREVERCEVWPVVGMDKYVDVRLTRETWAWIKEVLGCGGRGG